MMIGWATVWLITSVVADQGSSLLLDLTAPTVLPLRCVLSFHCTISFFSTTHCSLLRLIVRSGLDVPTFATRRLHVCHHARAPSGGRWNRGREMSGNFA